MAVGCPNVFVAEATCANAIKYWRAGNNPFIRKRLTQVMATMNKKERNNLVIPLLSWSWRYIAHLVSTLKHILEKAGKKDRQICDASFRHNGNSIPTNMMTLDVNRFELEGKFTANRFRVYRALRDSDGSL